SACLEFEWSREWSVLKIYTDWANHYLSKSGHRRLIRDLQTDVSDGVLLAQIIQVVANEKIGEIHGSPRSRSQMIENIDACLSFLAAKGVNIQGLSSEEIGNGNLKAILGLFFSLSRFKQQHSAPPQLSSLHPSHLSSPHGAPSTGQKHTAQGPSLQFKGPILHYVLICYNVVSSSKTDLELCFVSFTHVMGSTHGERRRSLSIYFQWSLCDSAKIAHLSHLRDKRKSCT
uniref:Calponin-homology (CH) domain-containing protein n=1 Tax=Periophthalmus magnuspinnatus TaxID=409849 RepID=A0A3B4B1F6_9GOBI